MKSFFIIVALLLYMGGVAQKPASSQLILCDSIPKAFTPNGDHINDFFSIAPYILTDLKIDSFSLKIVNRWGEVVFESTDLRSPWNGNDKKGKPVPAGIYIYITRASTRIEMAGECKGSITLIR